MQNRGSVIPCLHSTHTHTYTSVMREWDRSHVVPQLKWIAVFYFVDVIFFSSMTEYEQFRWESQFTTSLFFISVCVRKCFCCHCVSFYDVLIINRWVQFVRSNNKNQHQRHREEKKSDDIAEKKNTNLSHHLIKNCAHFISFLKVPIIMWWFLRLIKNCHCGCVTLAWVAAVIQIGSKNTHAVTAIKEQSCVYRTIYFKWCYKLSLNFTDMKHLNTANTNWFANKMKCWYGIK